MHYITIKNIKVQAMFSIIYKAELIFNEIYLINYIHYNPANAKICNINIEDIIQRK